MRLLIAEDEIDLAEALSAFLEKNQYTVDAVHDGQSAYDYASVEEYDAIILDIMMPKMDGLEVLRRLREQGNATPVMMLTARGEKNDRIVGFDAGADDYLPKPFEPDELLARLRAILRRRGGFTPTVLRFCDLSLDCGSKTITCGEKTERLSGREFQVMELFLGSPGTVLSTERIMERVWGWNADAEINVVWVHISNLRKKLKSIGSTAVIRASRGLGYVLEESSASEGRHD
jgi:DNA-binding response OmpR family regulator